MQIATFGAIIAVIGGVAIGAMPAGAQPAAAPGDRDRVTAAVPGDHRRLTAAAPPAAAPMRRHRARPMAAHRDDHDGAYAGGGMVGYPPGHADAPPPRAEGRPMEGYGAPPAPPMPPGPGPVRTEGNVQNPGSRSRN